MRDYLVILIFLLVLPAGEQANGARVQAGFLRGGDGLGELVEAIKKARKSIDAGLFF